MKKFIEPKSHIILALDLPDEKSAFKIAEQCYDLIDCIKLNYPLVLKEGINIINKLKQTFKLPIFADFKVADVPVTNDRIIKTVADAGADAIMVHGIIGPDALESAVKAADENISLVVQTEFTHPGGIIYTQKIADSLIELALQYNCAAIQCPGNRPNRIRKAKSLVGDQIKIVCCGVGAQGGDYHSVLDAGGDFPIIGRAIYQSEKPREFIINSILNKNNLEGRS